MKNKQIQLQLEAIRDKIERLKIQAEFYERLLGRQEKK